MNYDNADNCAEEAAIERPKHLWSRQTGFKPSQDDFKKTQENCQAYKDLKKIVYIRNSRTKSVKI